MDASPSLDDVEAWSLWLGAGHPSGGPRRSSPPLRVGVSGCLLGESVRYDGGHKRDRFLVDELGVYAEWVSVCPEVEVGLPIPRPPIQLVASDTSVAGGALRVVDPASGADHTEALRSFAERRVAGFGGLDAYVLKRGSPSCGMEQVPVFRTGSEPSRSGVGSFASALIQRWPDLPIEEEGRLADPVLRESFVERAFCRSRWRHLVDGRNAAPQLLPFHTAHELLLRVHSEQDAAELGRIAEKGSLDGDERLREYGAGFCATLRVPATPERHARVMELALASLQGRLAEQDPWPVRVALEAYRAGALPLAAPLALLRRLSVQHGDPYLRSQLYFDPYPRALRLRGRVQEPDELPSTP